MTTKEALDARGMVPNMTRDQLREAVAVLQHTANRRIGRAQSSDWTLAAPAFSGRVPEGGRFAQTFSTTRGMTLNQLRNRYVEVYDFLAAKSGTAAGAKRWREKQEKIIGHKFNSPQELKDFWEGIKKAKEERNGGFLGAPANLDTDEAAQAIAAIAVKSGVDSLRAARNVYLILNDYAQEGLPHTYEELVSKGLDEHVLDGLRQKYNVGGYADNEPRAPLKPGRGWSAF